MLTFYRLTFGQPRQEELAEALMREDMGQEEVSLLTSNLMSNLAPIYEMKTASIEKQE